MTIIRVHHDKNNPYVQLNKTAFWDSKLSLRAKGLWGQCMSRKDNWTFYVDQICKINKEGKKAVYSAIKELIEARYVLRFEGYRKDEGSGKFSTKIVEYVFLEVPANESLEEELKKCFRESLYGDLRKEPLIKKEGKRSSSSLREEEEKRNISISSEVKKEPQTASAPEVPAGPSGDLADFFLSKIKEEDPEYQLKNRTKWVKDCDAILRIDKRPLLEVMGLISWTRQDLFWKRNCLSPESMRRNYEKIRQAKFFAADKDRIRINREYAKSVQEKYPKEMRGMSFDAKFVYNKNRNLEVYLDLPPDSFKLAFKEVFEIL